MVVLAMMVVVVKMRVTAVYDDNGGVKLLVKVMVLVMLVLVVVVLLVVMVMVLDEGW